MYVSFSSSFSDSKYFLRAMRAHYGRSYPSLKTGSSQTGRSSLNLKSSSNSFSSSSFTPVLIPASYATLRNFAILSLSFRDTHIYEVPLTFFFGTVGLLEDFRKIELRMSFNFVF
jgi:hypothetical protein